MTATLRHLPLLIALLAFPPAVFAHQLDEYLQATLIDIDPGKVRLQINLTPGVAVVEPILALIDRNHDGVISTNEAMAYAELLKRELAVRLDQRNLELKLTTSEFPAADELRTGWSIIQLEFSATTGSFAAGAHTLAFENRHLTNVSVYLLNAAQPSSGAIEIARQRRNDNQSAGAIEFAFHPPRNSPGANRFPAFFAVLFAAVFVGMLWWRPRRRAKSSIRI